MENKWVIPEAVKKAVDDYFSYSGYEDVQVITDERIRSCAERYNEYLVRYKDPSDMMEYCTVRHYNPATEVVEDAFYDDYTLSEIEVAISDMVNSAKKYDEGWQICYGDEELEIDSDEYVIKSDVGTEWESL